MEIEEVEKEQKRERIDEREKRHFQSMVYFFLGILLSTCITAVSIAYVLPKTVVRTENKAVSAVSSELVRDTINASLGDYLASNKIVVSDDSIEEICQYIVDGVNSQTELTESKISEVKNLIKVSIQSANENVNTNTRSTNENLESSMITLQEFVVNGDNEISDALKNYIDKNVVPGINDSLEMNTEDIVSVNQTIVKMANEYDSYRETNNTSLAEIVETIERYREETGEEISECQTDLTERIDNFYTEYDSYVEETDSKIESIETSLGDYITVVDFEEFKDSYEVYKENMNDTVAGIKESIAVLDEKKADKTALEELAGNFESLRVAYNTFTGENGNFENLKNRVTTTETGIVQNSSDIVALEERITELEQNVINADTENSNNITALQEQLAKFYPIGYVYMTFGNENPADLYGGTWEKVEDTFLMCAGSAYPIGSSGGSNAVTLNAENIPSLSITGNTSVKNGVTTSANGAYNGTIISNGIYQGGTYGTSANGEHNHNFSAGGTALVVDSANNHPQMPYADGFAVTRNIDSWWCNHNKINSGIASAGNHSHTVFIPSQTITSSGNLSIGNHSHTVNIPALSLTGRYTNNSVQSVEVTNKYVTVNVWRRVA